MLRGTRAKLTVGVLGIVISAGTVLAAPLRAASQTTVPVIAAAGDIACDPAARNFNGGLGSGNHCREQATASLLVSGGYTAVLALGDDQYECGSLTAFNESYNPSWGQVKPTTYPVPGNHEYKTSGGTGCTSANAGAAGYFSYFGTAAGTPGQGWYSVDIGGWHLIALNSQCSVVGCGTTSAQYAWLRSDLAAHPTGCKLAFWHIPAFASSLASGATKPFWQLLYAAHADLILNGHYHAYERFAQQSPTGAATPDGIREFIAGTGGDDLAGPGSPRANLEMQNNTTFGVLSLTLDPSSYEWRFIPIAGSTFSDSGSATCHT